MPNTVQRRSLQQLARRQMPPHQPHSPAQHLHPLPKWEPRALQLVPQGRWQPGSALPTYISSPGRAGPPSLQPCMLPAPISEKQVKRVSIRLYMQQLIIVGGHNIKRITFGNFDFEDFEAAHCISRWCANGPPPSSIPCPKHAFGGIFHHSGWKKCEKRSVLEISTFELLRLKLLKQLAHWSLGKEAPGTPQPNAVKNTQRGLKHALHGMFHHFGSIFEVSIFELLRLKILWAGCAPTLWKSPSWGRKCAGLYILESKEEETEAE